MQEYYQSIQAKFSKTLRILPLHISLFFMTAPALLAQQSPQNAAFQSLARPHIPATLPAPTSKNGNIWLKGDLHIHSNHSKDASNNNVGKILSFARSTGFDFLAITDHDNHVNGDVAQHTWSDPDFKAEDIILLYGAEWTTHRGHACSFSATPYDHQALYNARNDRDWHIQQLKEKEGIHFSANHPSSGDPFDFSYDFSDSLEVWNSVKFSSGTLVWDDLLKSGRMITGRGGSDSHHGTPEGDEQPTKGTFERQYNYVGTPTTWVYTKEASASAVLEALSNGHVAITANPNSPRAELYADLDGDQKADIMMGDNAKPTGKPVNFHISLGGENLLKQAYDVRVIKNGSVFLSLKTDPATGRAVFRDTPDTKEWTYYRIEVLGEKNSYPEVPSAHLAGETMVSLSNPVYFNYDPAF